MIIILLQKWSDAYIYFLIHKCIGYAVPVTETGIQDNAYTRAHCPFGNAATTERKITVKCSLVLNKSQHSDMLHVVYKSKFHLYGQNTGTELLSSHLKIPTEWENCLLFNLTVSKWE